MKRKRAAAKAPARKQVANGYHVYEQEDNVLRIDKYTRSKQRRPQIYPKNLNQENYLFKLQDSNKKIIFAIGPAGTGKTMLAVQWAVEQLQKGEIDRIIITRPAVSVDEEHGFLPGDLNEKMAPWTKPIFDVIGESYSQREITQMVEEGIIETSPLAYMRGRTFKNAVVIADEMQNTTPSQMKMLLTRLGTDSKMIVTGDLNQADRPKENGLLDFLKLFGGFAARRYVDLCQFDIGDVERHEAVKEILAIYGDD
jgi:phosphate starvation-inducible PhoH-like protein